MAALIDLTRAGAAVGRPGAWTAQNGDTLAELHTALVRHEWSADALRVLLPRTLPLAAGLSPVERGAWLDGLRLAWSTGGLNDAMACAAALALAECWCDWPLVDALSADLQSLRGECAATGADEESAWIQALFRSGRSEAALQRCRRRMLSHPHEVWPARLHRTLSAWQCFVDARGPAIEGDGLRLEPLGHQHMADFAWQYHDPEIAELCCLPRFVDEREWHAWLDRCWGYGDQRLYAVLHPGCGFVGSVSLIEHAHVGFFYYWLGPDFQGHGLGPRAVHLLLAHAHQTRGLRSCHAKVFDHNRRSQRALEKLGFRALRVRGIAPFDSETFYRLRFGHDAADMRSPATADHDAGDAAEEARDVEELRWLLERMDAETRLAAPLVTAAPYRPMRGDAR